MRKSREAPQLLFRMVGRRLADRREGRFSQSALAEKAGLTRAAVSAIEAGQQGTSIVTLCQLALTLEVNPGELLPTLEELQELDRLIRETEQSRPAGQIVDEFLQGNGS